MRAPRPLAPAACPNMEASAIVEPRSQDLPTTRERSGGLGRKGFVCGCPEKKKRLSGWSEF